MKKDYPRPQKNDSWATDDWIQAMFPLSSSYADCASNPRLWFDPCPLDDNWTRNGLECAWMTHTFVNPPYSNPLPWVEKAIYLNKHEHMVIVMLLKHDSSTKWYAKLQEAGAKFLMIQGRLKFGTNKGCAFPSVLAVLT
jgi:hypothetical protein